MSCFSDNRYPDPCCLSGTGSEYEFDNDKNLSFLLFILMKKHMRPSVTFEKNECLAH